MVDTGRGWHTRCQFCYTGADHPVEHADDEEFEKHASGSSVVKSYDDTTTEGTPGGEVTVSFSGPETGVDVFKHHETGLDLPCIASYNSYSAAAEYAEVAFKFLRVAGCIDGDGAFFNLGLVRSHRRQFMIRWLLGVHVGTKTVLRRG